MMHDGLSTAVLQSSFHNMFTAFNNIASEQTFSSGGQMQPLNNFILAL